MEGSIPNKQRTIQTGYHIFWELLHKRVLTNYMDDFVIPAKIMKELEE